MNRYAALLALGCLAVAADVPPVMVSVDTKHAKGSFNGTGAMSIDGSMNKAKVTWYATIRNTSPRKVFRAMFCVKAFDSSNRQITPGGEQCAIRLWANEWQPGAALQFKGDQKVKIGEGKEAVHATRFEVEAVEVLDHSPNIRYLTVRCPLVWSAALRMFADKKFRPTVLDKDSFTATFAYDGGRVDSSAKDLLRAYTSANTGWTVNWESFRIDAASLYLREDKPGNCAAEVKMSFAGFGKPMFGQYGWYAVESNFNFEKALLDAVESQSAQVASADLDRAIGELPTEAPRQEILEAAKPQLTFTSEPAGAEIEIDGEYIGSTPTTAVVKEGAVSVVVKKTGYQVWERRMRLSSGDKRTIHAELAK